MAVLMGLLNQLDLYDRRVLDIPTADIDSVLALNLEEHNRALNLTLDFFCRRTTNVQERFKTPVNARLQGGDENSRADPVKGLNQYTVGYPLRIARHAWGATDIALERMTVEDFRIELETALMADINWMSDHCLAALFWNNTTSPWVWADPMYGNINVYGAADGDTTTYLKRNTGMATDDHVNGFTSITTANLTTVANDLREHPQNSGEVIIFFPTASVGTVEALTEFIPVSDPNLQYGTVTTTLRNFPTGMPGTVFGYVEGAKAFVAEWTSVPDNYLIGMMTGGSKPLALREDPIASLRGYRQIAERRDTPWYETHYRRLAGFGGNNRVGWYVAITNNATYSIPANLNASLMI
jgi:hypothetical protein